jgi:putative protease
MLNRLNDLERAGVDVLKIEGRARRPFYVYTATNAYKNALERKKVDVKELELAFNRTFTEGYFNGNKGIMSKLQNHIGVEVGQVKKVNSGKKFNEVFFTSNTPISKKSTLKFFAFGEERAVVSAFDITENSGLYRLTTTAKIQVGDKINLIADAEKENAVATLVVKKKLKINLEVKENENLLATFSVDGKDVRVLGDKTAAAKNRPITRDELVENFKKSEYFDCEIVANIEGSPFVVKSALNEWRRRVFSAAFDEFTKVDKKILQPIKISQPKRAKKFSDFKVIENLSELENIKENNVVYSPELYEEKAVLEFKQRCENMNKCAYLDTPNFALKKDVEILKGIVDRTKIKIIANNYYALNLTDDFVVGGGLNVYNQHAAEV